MDRATFARHLAEAVDRAVEFASELVVEKLPAERRFRVLLNQSYDRSAGPYATLYPEDSRPEVGDALHEVSFDSVVEALWRDSRIPEWVNVCVADETAAADDIGFTILELTCCGRFTPHDETLYHHAEGIPPFHVLGPPSPLGGGEWRSEENPPRRTIHSRAVCRTSPDAARLTHHAALVRHLELVSDGFDRDHFSQLPELPSLATLIHRRCALGGEAFRAFSRFPTLQNIELHLVSADFSIAGPGRCPDVRRFALRDLRPGPWGFRELADHMDAIDQFELYAESTITLDGPFPAEVGYLGIDAAEVSGQATFPSAARSISLRLWEGSDSTVARLLEPVQRVGSLNLQGTPVTERTVDGLVARLEPKHVHVGDTGIDPDGLRGLQARHPGVHFMPHLPN